jgi:hypothetical protein
VWGGVAFQTGRTASRKGQEWKELVLRVGQTHVDGAQVVGWDQAYPEDKGRDVG